MAYEQYDEAKEEFSVGDNYSSIQKKELDDYDFEDGGGKQFKDSSSKRHFRSFALAIGYALYLAVTGYSLTLAYNDISRNISNIQQMLMKEKANKQRQKMDEYRLALMQGIRKHMSKEDLNRIADEYGIDIDSQERDEYIFEIRFDMIKNDAEFLINKHIKTASDFIRKKSRSEEEFEKGLEEWKMDKYIDMAINYGTSYEDLEKIATRIGYTSKAEYYAAKQGKRGFGVIYYNSRNTGYHFINNTDRPLYNQDTDTPMILRTTDDNKTLDLLTNLYVDDSYGTGAIDVNIQKLIQTGNLVGDVGENNRFTFNSYDFSSAVRDTYGINEERVPHN